MSTLATTKMSSKGQVVIPEEIRKQLHLKSGMHFAVIAEADVVLLKIIESPKMRDFKRIVNKIQTSAQAAGLTENDLEEAIRNERSK